MRRRGARQAGRAVHGGPSRTAPPRPKVWKLNVAVCVATEDWGVGIWAIWGWEGEHYKRGIKTLGLRPGSGALGKVPEISVLCKGKRKKKTVLFSSQGCL